MNGNHVRSKLKIRSRILAIFLAFLLLSLMIPNAVFATESTDANSNDTAKEVNNEATDNAAAANEAAANEGEPAANAETISGNITNNKGNPIKIADIAAFKDGVQVGEATTSDDSGNFSINVDLASGQSVTVRIIAERYVYTIIEAVVGTPIYTVLSDQTYSSLFMPLKAKEHSSFAITTYYGTKSFTESVSAEMIHYGFPEGATYQMTHNAHLLIEFQNASNELIKLDFKGNGINS